MQERSKLQEWTLRGQAKSIGGGSSPTGLQVRSNLQEMTLRGQPKMKFNTPRSKGERQNTRNSIKIKVPLEE